jgi:Leucine-rich repeat (LRR) protein
MEEINKEKGIMNNVEKKYEDGIIPPATLTAPVFYFSFFLFPFSFLRRIKPFVLQTTLVFYFSFFLLPFSFSQDVPDSSFIYSDLEQAKSEPDKVFNLDLSKKKLSEFPMDVLQFKNLRTLNLSKNKIKTVPAEISQLTNLRELNLGNNKLTEFSASICELTELQKLVLNQNEIESIPAEIKNLKKMYYLDMWDNNLWFFPDELNELAETLKVLDLQNIQYNFEEQARIKNLLPKTKISMQPACNCKD